MDERTNEPADGSELDRRRRRRVRGLYDGSPRKKQQFSVGNKLAVGCFEQIATAALEATSSVAAAAAAAAAKCHAAAVDTTDRQTGQPRDAATLGGV